MDDATRGSLEGATSYNARLAERARQQPGEIPPDIRPLLPDPPIRFWKDIQPAQMEQNPSLQSALARLLDYSPSKWLLEQEAPLLQQIRSIHSPDDALPDYTPGKTDVYQWARQGELTGLCFSGGGIRSATFNLGILQGLAARGEGGTEAEKKAVKLRDFDYLSSVSGGGYIHGWLAAWFNRQAKAESRQQPAPAHEEALRSGFRSVVSELKPPPKGAGKIWPRQIEWLRKYSNYLTPDKGLFTGDTWAMVATWLRNVSLNQSLLLSIFALLLMLPHLLAPHDWVTPPPPAAARASQSVATVQAGGAQATLVLQLNPPPAAPPGPSGTAQAISLPDILGFSPRLWWIERGSGSGWTALATLAIAIIALCTLLRREYTRTRRQDLLDQNAREARATARERRAAAAKFQADEEFLRARTVQDQDERSAAAPEERKSLRAAEEAFAKADAAQAAADQNALPHKTDRRPHEWGLVLTLALVPLFLFGGFASDYVICGDADLGSLAYALLLEFLLLVAFGTFAGGAVSEWNLRSEGDGVPVTRRLSFRRGLFLVLVGAPAAIAGALGGVGIALWLQSASMKSIGTWLGLQDARPVQMVFGTVLFAWLPLVVLVIAAGLVGRWFPSWLGEWLARIRGYTLLAGLGWLAMCGISLLAPGVVAHAFHSGWIQWPALLAWAGSTLTSVLGGKSSKTSGEKNGAGTPGILNTLLLVGPWVYMLGVMIAVACVLDAMQGHDSSDRWFWLLCFLVPGFVTLVFGFTLDINEFSMHSFYRNRLTRCYLGASNLHRDPSRITGFDDRDTRGLQIARLRPDGASSDGKPNLYPGPFPIFCCSMNITHGEDLGWQERKAASFAFTPLYSGYDVPWMEGARSRTIAYNGYVPTCDFAVPGGPNVATAMAASGAAISPNMGYHTNPAMAFLLTMFDVRLGWWIPNPRRSPLAGQPVSPAAKTVDRPTPRFVPLWLGQELLGSISDTSAYVYLTDGGHFDNMGLYELVRRRCCHIVICDAEEDASYTYEGIGNAIRKCRLDFGVEIHLDLSSLTPNSESKLSPAHIAYGTIRYPETPDGKEGKIIYVKASLTGKPTGSSQQDPKGAVPLPNVPGDVQNYKLQHTAFPHDPTTNQWFTESQFESYRRLGQEVANSIVWQ